MKFEVKVMKSFILLMFHSYCGTVPFQRRYFHFTYLGQASERDVSSHTCCNSFI